MLSGAEVAVRSRSLAMGIVAALGIALTHLVYGGAFIKGFAARSLER